MDTLGEENLIIHVESLGKPTPNWLVVSSLASSYSHCVKEITGLCFM